MGLILNKATKFYVAVSAYAATGGPELLHQLVYNLRILGYDAYMYYIPNNITQPVHPALADYKNPFVRRLDDEENNVIIIPEIFEIIRFFQKIEKSQIVIWWLSVDNFFVSRSLSRFPENIYLNACRIINKIYGHNIIDIACKVLRMNKKFKAKKEKLIDKVKLHLVQSKYAFETLKSTGISENRIFYLSDYLNDDFLNIRFAKTERENIVLYNPSKGYRFTRKILKSAKEINFVPIANMNRTEVRSLLCKSKVYIDFGNHPGKDRMPRETAIAGCCIITGTRGSANNEYDVSINNKYKFNEHTAKISDIMECIQKCLTEYNNLIDDFEPYRIKILDEKNKFTTDLKLLLNEKSIDDPPQSYGSIRLDIN